MTVQEQWNIIKAEQEAQRQYPTSDGWEYMTVEGLKKQDDRQRVINRITDHKPWIYEVAFYHRAYNVAYIILRRKPVAA